MINHYLDFQRELKAIAKKTREPELISDIARQEASGEVVVLSDPNIGFVVMKCGYSGVTKVLFIWVAIANRKKTALEVAKVVENIAVDMNVEIIEFKTSRKGFRRMSKYYGCQFFGNDGDLDIYQKEVSNG